MINSYSEYQEREFIPDGDPIRGYQYFDNNCSGCHQQEGVSSNPEGPNLMGFLGKQVGTNDKKFKYSSAFKNESFIWDKRMLDRFLFAPVKMIRGTKMKIWGVQNEKDRQDLISYFYSEKQYQSRQFQKQQEYDQNLQNFKDNYDGSKKQKKRRKRKQQNSGDMDFDDF